MGFLTSFCGLAGPNTEPIWNFRHFLEEVFSETGFRLLGSWKLSIARSLKL